MNRRKGFAPLRRFFKMRVLGEYRRILCHFFGEKAAIFAKNLQ
jgi:hypothetical protein